MCSADVVWYGSLSWIFPLNFDHDLMTREMSGTSSPQSRFYRGRMASHLKAKEKETRRLVNLANTIFMGAFFKITFLILHYTYTQINSNELWQACFFNIVC